jgi:hypothetical protein
MLILTLLNFLSYETYIITKHLIKIMLSNLLKWQNYR